jgi:hypothetical protein
VTEAAQHVLRLPIHDQFPSGFSHVLRRTSVQCPISQKQFIDYNWVTALYKYVAIMGPSHQRGALGALNLDGDAGKSSFVTVSQPSTWVLAAEPALMNR